MALRRHPGNPILTRESLAGCAAPLADASSVFNPGAVRDGEWIRLLLRVQDRGRRTWLLPARSRDAVAFDVSREPAVLAGLADLPERVHHAYDPRLTRIDGAIHALLALDLDEDCRLGLARSEDGERWEFRGIVSEPGVRNGVLFPEKVGGRYLRLERPNRVTMPGGAASGDSIRLAASDDLLAWRPLDTVLTGRRRYWDELIGPGPPPLKTREGWLLVYHGLATHFAGANLYQAGVALLDLADPARLLARGTLNVLEPREPYEQVGQVPNVVFPTGLVADAEDAEGFASAEAGIRLYYGAADTCVALATGRVGDLLAACRL